MNGYKVPKEVTEEEWSSKKVWKLPYWGGIAEREEKRKELEYFEREEHSSKSRSCLTSLEADFEGDHSPHKRAVPPGKKVWESAIGMKSASTIYRI